GPTTASHALSQNCFRRQTGEESHQKLLIDDGHAWRAGLVEFGEVSPGEQRGPHCGKVVGAGGRVSLVGFVSIRRTGLAFDFNRSVRLIDPQWKNADERGISHFG